MRKPRWALWLLVATAGCTTFSGRGSPFDDPETTSDSIRLVVDNRNFNDGRLTALVDGRRRSLGSTSGLSSASYEIPVAGGLRLEIEIDLVGGGSFRTRSIAVAPGTVVDLIIGSELSRSYLQPRAGRRNLAEADSGAR